MVFVSNFGLKMALASTITGCHGNGSVLWSAAACRNAVTNGRPRCWVLIAPNIFIIFCALQTSHLVTGLMLLRQRTKT